MMRMLPSRSIRNPRRIRFGSNSRLCLLALPFAFLLPFVLAAMIAGFEPARPVRLAVVSLCWILSLWLSWLVLRLWFRLYLRVDFPMLEIGQASGPVVFDLRDPEVGIEVAAGVLVVTHRSDGRRVRAWGADGQQQNMSWISSGHITRIGWEFDELLRNKNGASLRVVDSAPSVPWSERFEILSWKGYRNTPNQRER